MKIKELRTQVADYLSYLEREERSAATRKQYQRDIFCFLSWAEGFEAVKKTVVRYKEKLQDGYKAASVNAKLAALNGFFSFLGRNDLKVKQLKIQRQAYCSVDRELTKNEYLRLVETAKRQQNEKLSLMLQTICSTGIRVSELRFITVEAIGCGEAAIRLKGKNRVILLPENLRRVLNAYIRRNQIISGPIFITRNGNCMDRSNICKQMKRLCAEAVVEEQKVFPHNLRHLFARCFYAIDRDLAKLADILGHSSVNTTRIYIVSTGSEHRQHMDALGLVV